MRRNGWSRAAAAVAIATATLGGAVRATAAPAKDVRMPGTYTTAYNWWDNNPPGSAAISHPVIHHRAGGDGTYGNPLTVAVNDARSGDGLQFRAGTRFYVPNVRAYLIVEDTIGDRADGRVHLDMWAGGKSSSERNSYRCMNQVTGTVLVIRNPSRKYAVVKGPLSANNKCRKTYGNAVRRVSRQVR
jgi:hypothetical protein